MSSIGNTLFKTASKPRSSLASGAAAKVIKKFSEEYNLPVVKGILFDGNYLAGEDFIKIAELPSKEESITNFAMMIKSPIQNLATMLKSPMANFVKLLNNIKVCVMYSKLTYTYI